MNQTRRTERVFFTQNDIPERDRISLVETLNRCLADTTDLQTQAKYAHWNVKGENFYQLHLLFDELAEVLSEHVDDVAERATALGGEATGTARMAASNSRLPEIRTEAVTGPEYVEALADNVAMHAANLRSDVETALSTDDQNTADLLTELSRDVDKYLWFLEAHLQTEPRVGPFEGEEGERQEAANREEGGGGREPEERRETVNRSGSANRRETANRSPRRYGGSASPRGR